MLKPSTKIKTEDMIENLIYDMNYNQDVGLNLGYSERTIRTAIAEKLDEVTNNDWYDYVDILNDIDDYQSYVMDLGRVGYSEKIITLFYRIWNNESILVIADEDAEGNPTGAEVKIIENDNDLLSELRELMKYHEHALYNF